MQPVLQMASLQGQELHDAVKLLNPYKHVFVGPDGKVGWTNACDWMGSILVIISPFNKDWEGCIQSLQQTIDD